MSNMLMKGVKNYEMLLEPWKNDFVISNLEWFLPQKDLW